MPKTTQSKLDYIKRYTIRKREEAKLNGTYIPPGRPRVEEKSIDEKREYQRAATRKHNVIISNKRLIAKQERIKQKAELQAIIDRIKSTPYEKLAKVKELLIEDDG